MIVFHVPFEGEFGARKNANRDLRLSNFRKNAEDHRFRPRLHRKRRGTACRNPDGTDEVLALLFGFDLLQASRDP